MTRPTIRQLVIWREAYRLAAPSPRANTVRWSFIAVIGIAVVLIGPAVGFGTDPGDCLTADEAELLDLINQYRASNTLPPVAWSRSLTAVAQWHVWDLENNSPEGGDCNLHSWSDQGFWSPVCYTSDHAQAAGMWNKPGEITNNAYPWPGYEIAAGGTMTPAAALQAWQSSSPHNDVMLNQGMWASHPWAAMGGGLYATWAVVWFGESSDPQGGVVPCSVWVFDDDFEVGDVVEWSLSVP